MRRTFLPGALALMFALLISETVLADTTYISDAIPVEVYSASMQRGVLVTTLQSGAIVEVTETDGDYSKIRTLDGKEGWVKSNYLTSEKPARAKYLQLTAKHKELENELEQLKAQLKDSSDAEQEKAANDKIRKDLAKAKNTIAGLEKQLKEKTDAFGDIQKQLEALKHQPAVSDAITGSQTTADTPSQTAVETADPQISSPTSPAPGLLDYPLAVKWSLVASLLGILLGMYLGHSWLDAKIRRRHGGVRIR